MATSLCRPLLSPRSGMYRLLSSSRCLFTSPVRLTAKEKSWLTSKDKEEDSLIDGKASLGEKRKRSLFGTSQVPSNIAFPNPKGVIGWEEREEEARELLKNAPAVMAKETKKLGSELYSIRGSVEKDEMMESFGTLKDNEARDEYRFDCEKALSLWHTGCDSDWHEGFSKGELVPTDKGTALFRGDISSRIVKDGRIERAGWASMKLEDKAAFNRRKYFRRWQNFSHLLIKCRGDGRSYKIMLHSPLSMDLTWGDSFSYPLHTHGGPYWQYARIPFSKFFHTVAGRIQDRQYPVNLEDASSISIVMMDRIDGPFQLELDWIGVVNDRSHVEEFAYETYTLPLWSTQGF